MAVPGPVPVTIPDVAPIVATVIGRLLQVPPPLASLRLVIPPLQITLMPVIAAGIGLTVTTCVIKLLQPEPLVTL